MIGAGSAVFHPEASKVAYMASGGKRGLAQSIFQVGGNTGSSLGPLLAAMIIVPFGQKSILWFSFLALVAIALLIHVGKWYRENIHRIRRRGKSSATEAHSNISQRKIVLAICILLILIFSKYFYLASMTSYFTFYLMDK